jgi:hypothetical protein
VEARARRVRASHPAWLDTAVLVAVAAAVYGHYVLHGGFSWDDWENAATTHLSYQSGFLGPFDLRAIAYEPGLGIMLALAHLLFGTRPAWHLALAVALAVAYSVLVARCLRELGLSRGPALAVAVLTLVFPWSGSLRLWATAGINHVAGCLYVLGLTAGVRELRDPDRPRRSTALYAASVLTYPAAILLVLAAPLVYRCFGTWSRAWRQGRADVIAGVALAIFGAIATTKPTQPPLDTAAHVWRIVAELGELLGRAIAPIPGLSPWIALAVVAVVVLAASARPDWRLWQLRFAAAALFALGAYLTFGPGEDKYRPLAPGIYDRVGLLAAPAVALAVVAFWALAGLMAHDLLGRRRVMTAVPLVAVLAVGAMWISHVSDDAATFESAAAKSRSVLSRLDARLPDDLGRATVFATGFQFFLKPGVPIFGAAFDLDAAFKLTRNSRDVTTYPVSGRLVCHQRGAAFAGGPYDLRRDVPYGALYAVNLEQGSVRRIGDRRACELSASAMFGAQ